MKVLTVDDKTVVEDAEPTVEIDNKLTKEELNR